MTTKAAPVLASRTFRILLIGVVCALLPIAASTADAAPQGPWSTSGRIDGAIGGASIATTEGGSATVVWPTAAEGVLAATQTPGESEFSPIEQVSTGLPPGVNSGIASLGDGRLQAAWVSDDGSIRTATQTIGVGWGAVTMISGPSETELFAFEVTKSTRGEICVTWNSDGFGGSAMISCGGPGGFEIPKSVSAAGERVRDLEVASGPDGTFAVDWLNLDDELKVAVRKPGREFSVPCVIKSTGGAYLQVSAGSKGDAGVAWTDYNDQATTSARLMIRSGKKNKWTKVRIPKSLHKETLAVFSLPGGVTSLAVMRSDERNPLVGTVRRGKISKFSRISPETAELSQFPDASVADNGTINLIWDTDSYQVIVATKLPGRPSWSSQVLEDEFNGFPVVASGDSGYAYATWTTGGEHIGDPSFIETAYARPDTTYCRKRPFKILRKRQKATGQIKLKVRGIQAGSLNSRANGLLRASRIKLIEGKISVLKVPLKAKAKKRLLGGQAIKARLRVRFRSNLGCKSRSITIRVRLNEL